MKDVDNVSKVLTQLSTLVGTKIDKLVDRLETELNMKIDDPELVQEILNAVQIVLQVEKKELKDEERLSAVELLKYQHQQIQLLDIMEQIIKQLHKKPDVAKQLTTIMQKLKSSFAEETLALRKAA